MVISCFCIEGIIFCFLLLLKRNNHAHFIVNIVYLPSPTAEQQQIHFSPHQKNKCQLQDLG
jgi:hypothetical protein